MPTTRVIRLLSVPVCGVALLAIAPSPARVAPAPAVAALAGQPASATQEGAKAADDAKADEKADEKADGKLTLERMFTEKSYWGPSASNMAFSHDGRFAAFLYRPWAERRHGSDLYIYDTTTGQSRRITSVGRMAEYQADAREVRDDREKQAKGAGITLAQLAREQAERLGWSRDTPAGAWAGEATSDAEQPAVRRARASSASTPRARGCGGERVGLVRLPLEKAEFDDAERKLTAEIDDKGLKVKGKLEATLAADGSGLSGTVTLETPRRRWRSPSRPRPRKRPARTSPASRRGFSGRSPSG